MEESCYKGGYCSLSFKNCICCNSRPVNNTDIVSAICLIPLKTASAGFEGVERILFTPQPSPSGVISIVTA